MPSSTTYIFGAVSRARDTGGPLVLTRGSVAAMHRLFPGTRAMVDAGCAAWNSLIAGTGRIRSLADVEWARPVNR